MNRTDRLLAIVLELQGRDLVTADELARTFEVTKRTIYRDVVALNEGGVPVVSAAGQGYWLMEGYFLPPVSLSPDEAIMLILGSDVMKRSFDAGYAEAASSASRKIEALLSASVQAEVAYLKENIRLISVESGAAMQVPDILQKLRRSIVQQTKVHIHYSKKTYREQPESSERHIDPHGLIHFNGTWMLAAYCHLRQAMRMFRLDRISKLELSESSFERQASFSVHDLKEPMGKNIKVELLFNSGVTQVVKERPNHFITGYEETAEGLKVTLKIRTFEASLAWILSWGANVKVLSPDALRQRVKQELMAMLARTE